MPKNSNDELYSYIDADKNLENDLKLSYDRLDLIRNYIEIYKKVSNSLENVDGSGDEKEVLIPLGGNVMLPATIKTSDSAIVGLGAGVYKEMKREKIQKKTEERIKNLYTIENDILDKISDISVKKLFIEAKIKELSENVR